MPRQRITIPVPQQENDELRQVYRRGILITGYWAHKSAHVYSQKTRVTSSDGRIAFTDSDVMSQLRSKPNGPKRAYFAISVRHNGRTLTVAVHALVMEAFHGPCPTGLEVCHEDGNSFNNAISNLRYGTRSSNMADKIRHGTHTIGEKNSQSKLTNSEAEKLRTLRASGVKLSVLSKMFKITEGTVSRIANGVLRSQKHTGE